MFAKDDAGAVKSVQSTFNGVGDMIVPGDGDGTEPRAKATEVQNSIYEQPNNKIIFQDISGSQDLATPEAPESDGE